ncbi:hypothetical protein [Aquiflexum sp.]|uniref:hypothetical protein n=1 Tax=Aquiflexum sp. TaxID=1872584 RepID=UPI003593B420
MKKSILIAIVFLSQLTMAQSPWVAEKGNGFFQLGGSFIGPYNTLFTDQNEDFITSRNLTDLTFQIYGEYGLGKGWETFFALPFVIQTSGELSENPSLNPTIERGNHSALGNIEWGIKKVLYNKELIVSAAIRTEVKTSSFDEATGLRSGYGAWGIAPSIMVGQGTDRFYAFLSTGPTLRSDGYSSEWRIQAEGGYKLGSNSYVMLNIFIVESFRNGEVELPNSNLETGFFVNNQSFFSFGPKLLTQFTDHIGLTGAVYFAASGNQVAKSPSVNLGVFKKF